jgi:hypothetical protein
MYPLNLTLEIQYLSVSKRISLIGGEVLKDPVVYEEESQLYKFLGVFSYVISISPLNFNEISFADV